MTPQWLRLRRLLRENDIQAMSMAGIWRLIIASEIFSPAEIDELCGQARDWLVARVLQRDPALRRLAEELGFDDPVVQTRLQQAIDQDRADLETEDEREGR